MTSISTESPDSSTSPSGVAAPFGTAPAGKPISTHPFEPPTVGQERVARWTLLAYAVISVVSLASWPVRRLASERGWIDVTADILNLPVAHSFFGAVLLFLLTGALVRRKRFALWIVIFFQALGVLATPTLILLKTTGQRPVSTRVLPE